MNKCRAGQKLIPEALYGELDMKTQEKLDRHLSSCRECSELYRKISETLRIMDEKPAPDPGPNFWDGYWDRLERRMAREAGARIQEVRAAGPPPGRRRTRLVPRWAFGAAGAVLLFAAGIFIGRTFFRPTADLARSAAISKSSPAAGLSVTPAAAVAPLAARASRYLDRSKVLLLAVVNYDPQASDLFSLNLPLQKKTSEELVKEAAVLKKELRASDRRLERLISDLEIILIQIANLKSETDLSAVEIIKSGIESKDVLFKINLSEMRRSSERGGAAARPSEPKRKPAKSGPAA